MLQCSSSNDLVEEGVQSSSRESADVIPTKLSIPAFYVLRQNVPHGSVQHCSSSPSRGLTIRVAQFLSRIDLRERRYMHRRE